MKVLKALSIVAIFSIGINVSAQSKEELTKKFNSIDADKNEVLTMREMKRYYEEKFKDDVELVNPKKLFYGLDANTNRIVTLNEYLGGVNWELAYEHSDKWQIKPSKADRLVQKDLKKVKVREKFSEFDSDKNKELSITEVVNYFRERKNEPVGNGVEVKLRFFAYDANNDGKITFEEFVLDPDWQKGSQRLREAERSENPDKVTQS